MTTVKQYLGIKQKYHQGILQKQKRFYLIQISNIKIQSSAFKKTYNPQQDKKTKRSKQQKGKQSKTIQKIINKISIQDDEQQWQGKISFQIGCRSSYTQIHFNDQMLKKAQSIYKSKMTNNQSRKQKTNQKYQHLKDKINTAIWYKQKQLFNDLHIFPFQKEQVMTIKFQTVDSNKGNNKQYSKQYGYAIIPLVPFIKMPHTQHQIQVQLVLQNQKKQIKRQVVAKLNINLYFMHNFKGRFFIQVVKADLGRNLALIGQMSPLIRMYLRDKQFQTSAIQQGGIKPHWKSYKEGEYCYFNIPLQSVFDDLFIYLFYSREVTMDQIVGKFKMDLQDEAMYKKGRHLGNFIEQTIKQIKVIKLQKLKEQKAKTVVKNEKTNKDKKQKIEYQMKQLLRKIKQERTKIFTQQIQSNRRKLIQQVVYKGNVIDSNNPPQLLNKYIQDIQYVYSSKFPQIQNKLKQQFIKSLVDCNKQEVEYYRFVAQQKINEFNLQKQIGKKLMEEINQMIQIIQKKMMVKQIPLQYTMTFNKNQLQKQTQIGKLQFQYLFLYQFDYIIKEQEVYKDQMVN